MNVHDLLAIPQGRNSGKVALRAAGQDGDPLDLTYAELHARARRLAAGLQKWGLAKGDRVAFFVSSRAEFVIAYLAVIRIGAVVVPINLRYRRLEIGHILADCAPRLLISEGEQMAVLAEVGKEADCLEATLLVDDWDDWFAEEATPPVVEGNDTALIVYTSGTTGRSKGAVISHNNLLATISGLLSAWAWEQDDRLLLCLPLFHVHGLVVGLHCALAAGATVLLHSRFSLSDIVDDLAGGEPTLFFAVPTIYVRLIDELAQRGAVNLDHMRLFCSGSAPLAAETHQEFERLTGQIILERYGMTETGMNLSNPYAGPRIPGTVGTPLPGVFMRIVDEAMQDLQPGQEGMLLVRGSNVFSAYWNAPEKTAQSFVHDAQGECWFITGDLARQDGESGYVTLLGRSHELIISGGFNIYPREIEEMLVTYEGVDEAAVIGLADPEWGEVPIAYLVCSASVDARALGAYCRGQLASFKVPREFHTIGELPRNAMGKLQKHLLKGASDA